MAVSSVLIQVVADWSFWRNVMTYRSKHVTDSCRCSIGGLEGSVPLDTAILDKDKESPLAGSVF